MGRRKKAGQCVQGRLVPIVAFTRPRGVAQVHSALRFDGVGRGRHRPRLFGPVMSQEPRELRLVAEEMAGKKSGARWSTQTAARGARPARSAPRDRAGWGPWLRRWQRGECWPLVHRAWGTQVGGGGGARGRLYLQQGRLGDGQLRAEHSVRVELPGVRGRTYGYDGPTPACPSRAHPRTRPRASHRRRCISPEQACRTCIA